MGIWKYVKKCGTEVSKSAKNALNAAKDLKWKRKDNYYNIGF